MQFGFPEVGNNWQIECGHQRDLLYLFGVILSQEAHTKGPKIPFQGHFFCGKGPQYIQV